MLIIRAEQMKAFEENALDMMYTRLAAHLRTTYPKETEPMPESQFHSLIRNGVEKAESYEIEEEADIQRFLGDMLMHGSDFDTDSAHPEVQEILTDNRLDGEEKVDYIELCYESS